MKLPSLFKRSTTGKISEWTIEVEGNKYRTISGFTDGLKVTSEWTECFGKNEGKSNSTDGNKQSLQQAKSLYKKRIELGAFESIKDIDNEVYFKPMLAHKIEDHWNIIEEAFRNRGGVYTQPKLDGIRCIAKENGLWTRNGKEIKSAPHIFEALKPLFEENPDLIIDGELYCEKLSNDFNKIISLVRKTKPTQEDLDESKKVIEYHIYDIPSNDGDFNKRFFDDHGWMSLPEYCKWVSTKLIFSKEEIKKSYEEYMEQGYEGQMIRLDGPYQNKRSKYLLKDKEFVDDEFVIEGVIEGKGNMKSKVGKVYFHTNDGVYVEAAVNAPWEELEEMWNRKDELVGKTATVKYFNKTNDGSLRFPKVTQIDRWSYE